MESIPNFLIFIFFLVLAIVTTIIEFPQDPMMKGLVLSPFIDKRCPDSERFSTFPKAFRLVSGRAGV